jgi:predicted nucleotidyltransferase
MVTVKLKKLLIELKRGLSSLYGPRLKSVYLYGSYARGDYDEESDLDVMIVLSDFDRRVAEIKRTSELIGNLSLEYGITVSAVFMREMEWKAGNLMLLRNVKAEGLAV